MAAQSSQQHTCAHGKKNVFLGSTRHTTQGATCGVGVGAATNVGGCTGAGAGTTAPGCTWTGTGSGDAEGTGLAGTFSWLGAGGNGEGVATRFGTAFVDTAVSGISVGWTVGGGGGGAMTTS